MLVGLVGTASRFGWVTVRFRLQPACSLLLCTLADCVGKDAAVAVGLAKLGSAGHPESAHLV